jgi:hypothetical protein
MTIMNRIFAWLIGPRSSHLSPAAQRSMSPTTSRRLFAAYLSSLNRSPTGWR